MTTTASGSTYTRTEFPNNMIPASRFDPIAVQLVNAYPAPQTSALSNNYTSYPLKLSDDNRGDVRIDHQITASQNFFARYSIDDTQIDMPNTYNGVIGGNENSFSGHQADRGQQGVLSYSKVITPSIIGEYRFGFNRYTSFLIASGVDPSPVFSEIAGGGPNPGYQPVAAARRGNSAPIISPSGFGGLGNSRGEPQIRREHGIENVGNVSWLRGTHSFKFGVDVINHMISETDTPRRKAHLAGLISTAISPTTRRLHRHGECHGFHAAGISDPNREGLLHSRYGACALHRIQLLCPRRLAHYP